jgi:hypothetical protein
MLHEFLTTNRNELISRCRTKAAKRFQPSTVPSVANHGVPLFLQQLVDTLREQTTPNSSIEPEKTPAHSEIGRAAALHGAELLRTGYSVDQVVHDYGDVCQTVTEMALEQKADFSMGEFRTLNRCLDNAIADAVTAYGEGRDTSTFSQAEFLGEHMGFMAEEQRKWIEMAMQAFSAIRTGDIGLTGATGTVLGTALVHLRAIVDRNLPQTRVAAGMTTPPPVHAPHFPGTSGTKRTGRTRRSS